ncbi:MAG: hypothetical protein H0T89_26405 [Deltaproteobacteria bacterium]|nr:hypothetical protein [Deltaproteobacteria bacterium]MDQ3299835.1 hypothetical protein [Myxococcota bacterium]
MVFESRLDMVEGFNKIAGDAVDVRATSPLCAHVIAPRATEVARFRPLANATREISSWRILGTALGLGLQNVLEPAMPAAAGTTNADLQVVYSDPFRFPDHVGSSRRSSSAL